MPTARRRQPFLPWAEHRASRALLLTGQAAGSSSGGLRGGDAGLLALGWPLACVRLCGGQSSPGGGSSSAQGHCHSASIRSLGVDRRVLWTSRATRFRLQRPGHRTTAATSPTSALPRGQGQPSAIVLTLCTKINKLGLQPYGGRNGVLSGRGLPTPGGRPDPDSQPPSQSLLPQWGPKFMATLT